LIYDPEAGDRHNSGILSSIMPELKCYDSSFGAPFRSRTVPSMKLLVHTGIDIIEGTCTAADPLNLFLSLFRTTFPALSVR